MHFLPLRLETVLTIQYPNNLSTAIFTSEGFLLLPSALNLRKWSTTQRMQLRLQKKKQSLPEISTKKHPRQKLTKMRAAVLELLIYGAFAATRGALEFIPGCRDYNKTLLNISLHYLQAGLF